MIRNIVIDFGGVLIALNKQASIQAFRDLGMESVAELINDYRSEGIFNELEHGKIDIHRFCDEARRISGVDVTDEAICDAWQRLLHELQF